MRKIKYVYEILLVTLGCIINAIGIKALIEPAHLMSGGVTGISMIINHYVPLSLGLLYLILNIPLLILGYKHLGKKFILYTIYSVILISVCLAYIKINHEFTDNQLLAAIFGGIMSSCGGAIVLRVGGSTGGLDIVGRVIAKYRNITIGKLSMSLNLIIISVSAYLYDIETAMFTLIAMFVGMKTYNMILNHVDKITVLIITENGDEITKQIMEQMKRGVTTWNADGAYTHSSKNILLCSLVNVQLMDLKKIVTTIDEKAFIIVLPTINTVGNFHKIW